MKIAMFSAFLVLALSGCTKTTVQQVNQVYSAIYTITPDKWVAAQDQGSGTKYYFTTLSIPELTQQIDLNGGVVVYLTFDDPTSGDPLYEALPETFDAVAYGALHTTGTVTIDLRAADGGDMTSAISSTVGIKVILMDAQSLD